MHPMATETQSGIGLQCHGPLLEVWARRQLLRWLDTAYEMETKTWQTSTDPGVEVWDSAPENALIDPMGR